MQERRAGAVAFGVVLGVADQPVQVIAFELVGRAGQGQWVTDPIEAGAGPEYPGKGQCTEGGIAAGAAAPDKGLL
ncbi:hypothetical protein D3C81_1982050 [compost metagenome]